MKERPASFFAHLLSVQAAVLAKNHSQANFERRGGGRGKDNREDELSLSLSLELSTRESKQGNGRVCFLDDCDCSVGGTKL